MVKKKYDNPLVKFETESIARFFRHNESQLNYDQFLNKDSLLKARQYLKSHQIWLDQAETRFAVEKEIIVAILLVETRLGSFLGRDPTLNTLSSMASLSDPIIRDMFWKTIHQSTTMTYEKYKLRADKKSAWAYQELKAFLNYVEQESITDPVAIIGSYAGAIGIPQFMPSNIITLAIDGDKDGRLNLFNHVDAIFSVANYLKRYGWKPGLDHNQAYKVLFYYNHSK